MSHMAKETHIFPDLQRSDLLLERFHQRPIAGDQEQEVASPLAISPATASSKSE